MKKLPFRYLLAAVLAAAFVGGFATVVLSGATTNEGTTGVIRTERAMILSAEKTRCRTYGSYTSLTTLRKEGLLTFKPVYNEVVYVPGPRCGTLIIGSPSYQPSSN